MDRIILFDIDNTLFNREKYLSGFYIFLNTKFVLSQSEVLNIQNFYEDIKKEFGFFSPNQLLAKIYTNFPKLEGKLDFYFSSDNLQEFLHEDSKIIFELKNIRLGIFSKGDLDFQKYKIKSFESILERNLIYIFHNKLDKLPDIINSHKGSEIYIVDDSVEVLLVAKESDKNIKTILIDREDNNLKSNGIDFKIKGLSDIISILNKSH